MAVHERYELQLAIDGLNAEILLKLFH